MSAVNGQVIHLPVELPVVYHEPPHQEVWRGCRIAVALHAAGLATWTLLELDANATDWLVPDGWRVFLWVVPALTIPLGLFTLAWGIELLWCWRQGHRSFVYWLYRPQPDSFDPALEPAIYAGETVNPDNRIEGHRRDGRKHWRKQDWARNTRMRVIRQTRPGDQRHRVEARAKLFGSVWARLHGRFWGGAEGFVGAEGTPTKLRAVFWVAVWAWGAVCFPRHYHPGNAGRPLAASVLHRMAEVLAR